MADNLIIQQIQSANSIEQVKSILGTISATADRAGAVLYSGRVGGAFSSNQIAVEYVKKMGVSIIDDTSFAKFMAANDEIIGDGSIFDGPAAQP